ncbi:MAG: phage tail tube protein [Wenzhouxiangella sp.]
MAFTKQYFRRKVLFAKVEDTYGTDATPDGTLNAILTRDLTIEPLNGEVLSRELDKPTFGADPATRVGVHARVTFSVEIAGSGAPGDLPAYHPLMLGSGHDHTILDDGGGTPVDIAVRYRPKDTDVASLTLYIPWDRTLHKLVGARGSLTLTGAKRQYGYLQFEFLGLIESITDQASMPTTDTSAFVKPVPFREATVDFEAFGAVRALHSFTLNGGQEVAFYEHSESESIEQENRSSSFEALVEQQLIADWGVWASIQSDALGALKLIWSPASDDGSNTVGIYVANAQITEVSQSDEQGVKALQLSGPCTTDGSTPDYEIIVGTQPT